jgi:hypothetical protein
MTIDARALAGVGIRRVPVAAVGAGTAVATVALTVAALSAEVADDLLPVVRVAAVVVAASCAGAVGDPTAPLIDSMWRGRRRRAVFVLIPTMMLAVATWSAAVVAAQALTSGPSLPLGGLIVELVAITLVCWIVTAALAATRGERGAALAGGSCVMVLTLGTMSVPRTIGWLWRSPHQDWVVSHVRWIVIAAVAAVGLLVVWRDPAH